MSPLTSYQRSWIQKNSVWVLAMVFVVLLVLKFLWPLVVYRVPLGYDLGFYRYLFIRHADGFPPFVVAPMDEWAKAHPLGLFFFTTILLKLGIPVSWLLGWMWNVMPVLLAAVFAWVIGKRDGRMIGVLVLLAAILSVSYFDGFAAMYWKTYASLLWCVITYHLLERKSWWAALTGIIAVATHHQTGLLFGLAFGSWVLAGFLQQVRQNPRAAFRTALPPVLVGVIVVIIGLLTYLPVWNEAILPHISELLAGDDAVGGSFPTALFYLQTEGILLALGAVGFALSFKRERYTLWQFSVFWSFVFVAGHLLFYKRFFLQLDFFLFPFAALAIQTFWMRFSKPLYRYILILAFVIQSVTMIGVIITRTPTVAAADLDAVEQFSNTLPKDALVLGLDNQSVTLLRGWLPYVHVGGPGLFESSWSYDQWKSFILGTHADRVSLLTPLTGSVYIFASPYFMSYYGSVATTFLQDSCFAPTAYPSLYIVTCTTR